MSITPPKIPEWHNVTKELFNREIAPRFQPAVLRQAARDWPATEKALESAEAVAHYIAQFDSGEPVNAWVGDPAIKGRFFYSADFQGLNFRQAPNYLQPTLGRLLDARQESEPPALYVGAHSVAQTLPNFTRDNALDLVDEAVVPNIWLGNRVTIAPHFDLSDNLACVVAGRRRFTLFPPEQVSNLYVGPIDFTPAGQPISLVSVKEPDFERFPRFRQALEAAQVAELEPGDVIYIPSLWWHNVEALDDFNILINYWWDEAVPGASSPFDAMVHARQAIASLGPGKSQAWQSLFNHYVFETEGDPGAHLPSQARGPLGNLTPEMARYINNYLRQTFQ